MAGKPFSLARRPGPSKRLRIGLFGGSFNPAHGGHLHVAQTALTRLQLDWIWWIVAQGNPLKQQHGVFDARLASARRIVGDHPRMRVTGIEAALDIRYTRTLVSVLTNRCPGANFVWVMGADSLGAFHRWEDWQTIARTVPIAAVSRPDAGVNAKLGRFSRTFAADRWPEYRAGSLADATAPAWTILHAPLHPASSTRIRSRMRARNPFRRGVS